MGGNANLIISKNTISNNLGVESSDGSGSAGIIVSSHFTGVITPPTPLPTASVNENLLFNNSVGLYVGFDAADLSVVTAHNNGITGNPIAILSTNPTVDATCNWYGTVDGDQIAASVSGDVVFSPWLMDGTNHATGTGFVQTNPNCGGTSVVLGTVVSDNILCGEGAISGSLTVSFSGGTGPYGISWTGPVPGSSSNITSPYIIGGLSAGAYTFTITDANLTSVGGGESVLYLPVTNTSDSPDTHYPTIQAAINAATANDMIEVCAGEYTEVGQIVIDKNLSIVGADKATTIIKPSQNTGNSGDARGWFLVNPGITCNLSKVTLERNV